MNVSRILQLLQYWLGAKNYAIPPDINESSCNSVFLA